MRKVIAVIGLSFALAGCLSFSSSNPDPPANATVVPAR
jgi:hypothetical protein